MKNLKRLIAALAAAAMAAGSIAFAARDRGERVTLIVEVEGDAVLEAENAVQMGFKLFSETDEAAKTEQNIRDAHSKVQSEIKQTVDRGARVGYTYTHVLNGFSLEAYESDIENIKALPNVEHVYISRTYKELEDSETEAAPYIESGCEMMHTEYMHKEGYRGEGTVIAVIDNGFDVSHENFQGGISNPKLTKSDIGEAIKAKSLSINSMGGNVSVNRVYRSEKIPYAFNYYTKSSDTVNVRNSHGTHVAGIAAGNNGTDADGNKFVGTAPDAQLLLMACTTLTTESILASIDDAVKLGADVINASWGEEYIESDDVGQKAVDTAVKAGVLFSAAAGNSSRGYDDIAPNVKNIDYGGSATPAYFTSATSVASVNNGTDKMSSFSSWGVNSALELKPEITTAGGNIYSSINDDKYRSSSGTSMAAPHMAGAAALMSEYIDKNSSKYGAVTNKASLIENLIMTTADVVIQDTENEIPYSPRLQGAGMVNLEKAAKTPVTLIGDTYGADSDIIRKSKLSLGEIGDGFELDFKAINYSGAPVTYDKVSMTVITDKADENGIAGDMRTLDFDAELPEAVTVGAHQEENIKINVTLDKAELAENMETFINGFFIDGFVFLESSGEDISEISIPFTGFYGGWDSAPALDEPMFSGKSVIGGTYVYSFSRRNVKGLLDANSYSKPLGKNLFVSESREDYDEYCGEDFAGVSPNGDGENDYASVVAMPLRRLGKTDLVLLDSGGNIIAQKTDTDGVTGEYYYAEKFNNTYLYFDDSVINALPDGDYKYKVLSCFYGQKGHEQNGYNQNEEIEMKFYIDREKPVITKFETRKDGDKTYLDIAAEDNRHLMGIIVSGTKNEEPVRIIYPLKGDAQYTAAINVTGVDEGTLSVEAVDYALNSVKRTDKGFNIAYGGKNGSNYIFTVSNTTGGQISAAVTMALYNKGELVGISSRDEIIPEDSSYTIFNMPNIAYDAIKIFVWNSLEDMKPLYDVFEF